MKVAILGAGRRGIRLAKHLVEEKRDVIILDEDSSAVDKVMQSVDCIAYNANGTDASSIKGLGLDDADAFVALTGSDETNIVSCSLVSAMFGIKLTIAAVRNLSYTRTDSIMGVTHVINPYQEVAYHIWQDVERGIYSENISFEDSDLVLYNVFVDRHSKYSNKLVKNIRHSVDGRFVIAALSRDGQVVVPNGETKILTGDTLSLAVEENSVGKILDSVGCRRLRPKKIAVVGSTKVTDFILDCFKGREQSSITVIAKDSDACRRLAEKYPRALIINSNITEEGIFRQEGLDSYDLLIAATDSDELNIITASYAKNFGVSNSMAIVNKNPDFLHMAGHLNIDSLISAQDVTVDSIMRYMHGKDVCGVHSLFDGRLEAFEFTIRTDNPICDKQLKDIDMRGKGLVVGITHDGVTTVPGGMDYLRNGDLVVVVVKREAIEFVKKLIGMNTES